MKAGHVCLLLLMCASAALTACGNTPNKKTAFAFGKKESAWKMINGQSVRKGT